ncbi:MAG: hypothetical protein DRQ88_00940 [Epsilonproteobacteria bacterium]|nr:MAG: hypothetical protein DRQ89_10100 [Campylobacterota bacterium]RLA67860.1 MAG: hypothetical protein DRQ88_00940 [Campylobacterota bacterium]
MRYLLLFIFFSCSVKTPFKDYSGIYQSARNYEVTKPNDIEEARKIIKMAYQQGRYLRFSGSNHSQNGFSLPKENEVLIKTKNLNKLSFINEKKIRVGAGINLWYLNEFLRPYNLKLPLINGGGAAPGLGGFISAGGISPNSQIYGGFWENVEEITLIVKNGELLKLKRNDFIFPWIFGSMGQLGLIVNATLRIVPINKNMKITLPEKRKMNFEYFYDGKHKRPLYWFNLFLAKNQLEKGKAELNQFKKNHAKYFTDLEPYRWPIKFHQFNPPLIFPKDESFFCLGVFSDLKRSYGFKELKEIDRAFSELVQKNGFGRYIQSERDIRPEGLRSLWGEKLYKRFYELKKLYDPKFLFNQDSVFPKLL